MALEGTLNYLDISHLLQVVGATQKSGVLEIRWQEREARLFFNQGRLLRAESNRNYTGIGDLLVEAGVLTGEMLERALETQHDEGGKRLLGAILCDELGVDTQDLQRMLQRQFEQIVYDVFSWPGGSFVFRFQEPSEVLDRFHLNPAEFILEVGLQAGFLAEEGVGKEFADPGRNPIAMLVGEEELAEQCFTHWRRKGHRVIRCGRVAEVLGFLDELGDAPAVPVVLLDLDRPLGDPGVAADGLEILSGLRAVRPDVPVVGLGGADAQSRLLARRSGALGYVKKPLPEELRGAQGETFLDVFLLSLDKALQLAVAACAPAGPGAGA